MTPLRVPLPRRGNSVEKRLSSGIILCKVSHMYDGGGMTLIEIHGRLANTALIYTAIMALWGIWRFFRRQGIDSSYWGAVVIAEVLYIIQSGLGAYLYFSGIGNLAGRGIHILYGTVAILVAPALFVFTRGDENRRAVLVYGVGFLFLIGIIIRAMATVGAI